MSLSKNKKITRLTGLMLLLICFKSVPQNGEFDKYDCNLSKEILIPFDYSENQATNKPLLNQTVFYGYRDQFTYWYRILAKKDFTVYFNISALNDSDSYSIYTYQYNNTDFCNKLYQLKIMPISAAFDACKPNQISKTPARKIELKKDNIYYISIVSTSLGNCGHLLYLKNNSDTLKVKALHMPCKKDISYISVTKTNVKPTLKNSDSLNNLKPQNTVKPSENKNNKEWVLIEDNKKNTKDSLTVIKTKGIPIASTPTVINSSLIKDSTQFQATHISNNIKKKIVFIIQDSKKRNNINATFNVTDNESGDNIYPVPEGEGKWSLETITGITLDLKCTLVGYKTLSTGISTGTATTVFLKLEPLKVGDNFIMKSIYFHPNTYALRNESAAELNGLLLFLVNHPTVNIEIQGHTNGDNKIFKNKMYMNLGEEWNFQGSARKLSLKRAETIKEFLVNNGISPERLTPKGYGGSKPIIDNPVTTGEGQRNIRVEVLILKD